MFEKIPSFRDFVIYVVPGFLFNIVLLSLFFELNFITIDLSFETIFNSSSFLTGLILASFLTGFIQSQAQIIVVNKILYHKEDDIRLIKNLPLPPPIIDQLVKKLRDDFNLTNETDDQIKSAHQYLHLCFSRVISNCSDIVIQNLNRSSYLSLFASAIILPISLILIYLSLKVNWPWATRVIIFSALIFFAVKICFHACKVFRKDWIASTYKMYLFGGEDKGKNWY